MFKLRHLLLDNFFSFESARIDFSKGLMLITGYDEGGKDSNGCGKSTILNAICWALFGRTLKGVSGKDVVRWGSKDCKVILILEGGGHVYEITRKLDGLSFKIDSRSISGHHKDIQSSIEDTFRTNYALFIRSTAFSQGQVEFLAASGDADKKRLFKEVLSLSRLDKAYDKIKLRYDSIFRTTERLDSELRASIDRRKDLQEKIQQAKDAQEAWEGTKQTKIIQLKDQKNQKPDSLSAIDTELLSIEKELSEIEDPQDKISEYEAKIVRLDMDNRSYEKEISRIWAMIEKGGSVGERCELCGSVVNKKMLGAHKREMEEKVAELKRQIDSLGADRRDAREKLNKYSEQKMYRQHLLTEQAKLSLNRKILEQAWKYYEQSVKDIDKQIKEIEAGDNPYGKYVESFTKEYQSLSDQVKYVEGQFVDAQKQIDVLSFLKNTFSREGVVSHIIEKEYASLVSYTNHMLSDISGGKLRIVISPQRELKSGALKEEIDISVFVNDQRTTYWGISDGQRQRINIALLLALNKLCKMKGVNSFDFLLLDEVLDISLAEGGQQDVLNLLKNYMRECSSIIMISHKDTFKTSFNSCLSVYRDENGISRLTR